MSFQPPAHWAPPATYRTPRLAYVLAVAVALLLVAAIAVPVGIAALIYRGDWPPARTRGVPPTAASGGANGAGDPYFPDYGSSGYNAAKYTVAVDFDPQTQRLTGRTVVAAQATEQLASFYLDLALPATRVLVNDVEATFRLEGFQDLLITPATTGSRWPVVLGDGGVRGKTGLGASGRDGGRAVARRRRRVDGGRRARVLGVVVSGQRPSVRSGAVGRLGPGSGGLPGDQRRSTGQQGHGPGVRLRHLALADQRVAADLRVLPRHRSLRAEAGRGRRASVRLRRQHPALRRGPDEAVHRDGTDAQPRPELEAVAGPLSVQRDRWFRPGHRAVVRRSGDGDPARSTRPGRCWTSGSARSCWCTSWRTCGSAITSPCCSGTTSSSTRRSRRGRTGRSSNGVVGGRLTPSWTPPTGDTKDRPEFWQVTMIDPGPGPPVQHRLRPRSDGRPGSRQRVGRPRRSTSW